MNEYAKLHRLCRISLRLVWAKRNQFRLDRNTEQQRLCEKLILLVTGVRLIGIVLHIGFVWTLISLAPTLQKAWTIHFQSSLSYVFVAFPLIMMGLFLLAHGKFLLSFHMDVDNIRFPKTKAEFLLHLLLPRENREGAIGDLCEEAEAIHEKFGPAHARIFWCCEVFKSLSSLLWNGAQKLLTFGVFDWLRSRV